MLCQGHLAVTAYAYNLNNFEVVKGETRFFGLAEFAVWGNHLGVGELALGRRQQLERGSSIG